MLRIVLPVGIGDCGAADDDGCLRGVVLELVPALSVQREGRVRGRYKKSGRIIRPDFLLFDSVSADSRHEASPVCDRLFGDAPDSATAFRSSRGDGAQQAPRIERPGDQVGAPEFRGFSTP